MRFPVIFTSACLAFFISSSLTAVSSQIKKTAPPNTTLEKSASNPTTSTVISKPPVNKLAAFINSDVEKAVLEELNLARRDPQNYAGYLEEFRKLYKGNTIYNKNFVRIETFEGVAAVDEAIAFLKTASPVEPYKFSDGLNKAAQAQLADLIENSSLGHTGKDGSDLPTRLAKFGKVTGRNAENIAFYAESPRNIVIRMIIDDGLKTRNHRKNLFSTELKLIGIAFGKGKSGEGLCVLDFAAAFAENGKPSSTVMEF